LSPVVLTDLASVITLLFSRLPAHFFFQAEDGIRDFHVTGVQTCALPIFAEISNVCRVPATTSSPCAFTRKSPCRPGSPVDGLRQIGRASCRGSAEVRGTA